MSSVPATLPQRPAPPAGLPAVARAAWTAIVNDYRPGHFSAANLILLEQLCRARALIDQCDRHLARKGLLIDRKKANPLIQVRAQAWAEVRACATKLRLAISSTIRAEAAVARPDPAGASRKKPWERRA